MSENAWSPGDQNLRADSPQGINLAGNLVPGAPPPAAAEASWSREDQDVVPSWSPEDHLHAGPGPWCSTLPRFGEGRWQGWFPEDQIPSRTDPHGTRSTRNLVLGGSAACQLLAGWLTDWLAG